MITGDRVILDTKEQTGLCGTYKNGDVLTLGQAYGPNAFYIEGTTLQVHTDWVKPYFNLGDRVQTKGNCHIPAGEYTLIVSSYHTDKTKAADRHGHYCVKYNGRKVFLCEDEIEKVAPKFKIGDKVRISGSRHKNGEFVISAPPAAYAVPGGAADCDGDYWCGSSCIGRPNRDGDGRVFELVTEPEVKVKNQVVYRVQCGQVQSGQKYTRNSGEHFVVPDNNVGICVTNLGWFDSKQAAIDALVKELSR